MYHLESINALPRWWSQRRDRVYSRQWVFKISCNFNVCGVYYNVCDKSIKNKYKASNDTFVLKFPTPLIRDKQLLMCKNLKIGWHFIFCSFRESGWIYYMLPFNEKYYISQYFLCWKFDSLFSDLWALLMLRSQRYH